MLDIQFLRENLDIVKAGAAKKHMPCDFDKLLSVDATRLELLCEIESLRAEQNQTSEAKERLHSKEASYKEVMREWHALMLTVPNIPDMSVPEGADATTNQEIHAWGEKPKFTFAAKDHVGLMRALDMLALDLDQKVSGLRGYVLKNDGVRLSLAVWQCALDFFSKKGLAPMLVPSLIKREYLLGTGFLPQGEEDLYRTQDNDFLSSASHIATMGYYMNEMLEADELPIKMLSFSPSFERESGSQGHDEKGLTRVHEFYTWEQVILATANHQESVDLHEWLHRNSEEFIEMLGIPYRTVVNSGGDLGLGQVKKYTIEVWMPLAQHYREMGSTSYFHDFQTRRLHIRYRDREGKVRYAHSLHGTAIPTPRILVSLVEQYQQADGSVRLPEVLHAYMGTGLLTPRLPL